MGPAGMSVSEEVLGLFHAFGDYERKAKVRELSAAVRRMGQFIKTVRDDFDCDRDAHRYGTLCRACEAKKIIPDERNS